MGEILLPFPPSLYCTGTPIPVAAPISAPLPYRQHCGALPLPLLPPHCQGGTESCGTAHERKQWGLLRGPPSFSSPEPQQEGCSSSIQAGGQLFPTPPTKGQKPHGAVTSVPITSQPQGSDTAGPFLLLAPTGQ